jgi:hypothetical protein
VLLITGVALGEPMNSCGRTQTAGSSRARTLLM